MAEYVIILALISGLDWLERVTAALGAQVLVASAAVAAVLLTGYLVVRR